MMQKSELDAIKRRSSINTILLLVGVNCLVVLVFFQTLYVPQNDFSKLKPASLADEITRLAEQPQRACLDLSSVTSDQASQIEAKTGITSTPCSQDCGLCLKVRQGESEMKKQAIITIGDKGEVDIQLKNAGKVPRDFGQILAKLAGQYDMIIGEATAERPILHQVKSLQVTQVKVIDQLADKSQAQFFKADQVGNLAHGIIQEIYQDSNQAPEVVFKKGFLSQDIQPQLFTTENSEEDGEVVKTLHLNADAVHQFYQKYDQTHLIPEFSRAVQDLVKHIQVVIFDTASTDMAFLKKSGQKFQVIFSETQDMVFAIVNTDQDPDIDRKLGKLIEMAIQDSLGVETMQTVIDFARKKQVQIIESSQRGKDLQMATFRKTQLRLDLVQQLRHMLAAVTFLEQNTIESNKVIYEDMTLKELAEQVYDEILTIAQEAQSLEALKAVPLSTKEKIGTLLGSKEMNPALFFSFQFKLGVYLPILAPFIVPLVLTFTLVIRRKMFLALCKKDGGKVKKE